MSTLILHAETRSLVVGQQTQLSLKSVTKQQSLSWTSSDSRIATVDQTGLVTGIKQSSSPVTITGMDEDENTASVTLYVGSLEVAPRDTAIETGNDITFSVRGVDAVTWTSLNKAVVTIGPEDGKAEAINLGTAIIQAADANGNVGYATLRAGMLLVYGADGALYALTPDVWTLATIVPTQSSQVPSLSDMNSKAQSSDKTLASYVPPSPTWTTCYVLNPSPITPAPGKLVRKV
ncbi:Ig-like domain-containing protein [Polyangium fumosum]|uniref:BIG2 domain-containing protein n=1 Tax=Polyangium fumosum TaxID=889272 RepID=A0A4U1J2B2_9BACT|nr:Ig-like domain-containing protein [Polyangium fumosum]TKD01213.1 hypothetical protein E8A74_31935 [Polyangium fumosum]